MTTHVVIPASNRDGAHRTRNRNYVQAWWESRGFRVHVAFCPTVEWSKGATVNPAVAACSADVVVVADGDSLIPDDRLETAISDAGAFGWGVGHLSIRRLTEDATVALIAGKPGRLRTERSAYPGVAGGGIVMVRKDAWMQVGGFDPRYLGWGGEDYSLGIALRTVTGFNPEPRRRGVLTHLWHPKAPAHNSPSLATRLLHRRYCSARSDRDSMLALVEEGKAWLSQATL